MNRSAELIQINLTDRYINEIPSPLFLNAEADYHRERRVRKNHMSAASHNDQNTDNGSRLNVRIKWP